jgi:ABC-type glutathione transport system ATPase component
MIQYPYIGLRPFEAEESDIFFGREQHTDKLLARLSQQNFLAVVGSSGCGKSSLVKTGLVPNLQAGFLAGAGTRWHITTIRPGTRPFNNLAESLVKVLGEDYRT